jgi:uncharacterized UPF0160 family protein
MQKIPRSCGTHDGTFHADEVTACALLVLCGLIDKEKIIRTRDPQKLAQCEYVCDVGGVFDPERKLFDHHQAEYQGTLSSAGMVLNYVRQTGRLGAQEADFLNQSLIIGVDAHDNGRELHSKGVCIYSHIISNFTPIRTDAGTQAQDEAFFQAFDFALKHLQRLMERYRYVQSCREIVAQAMAKKTDYLLFDQSLPWMDLFFEMGGSAHPAKFVIMPFEQHWKLRGIPPSPEEKMKVRQPLPQEWAGLLDKNLKQVSGIEGAVFCHKGRFISVWETKEDAMRALEYILRHPSSGEQP